MTQLANRPSSLNPEQLAKLGIDVASLLHEEIADAPSDEGRRSLVGESIDSNFANSPVLLDIAEETSQELNRIRGKLNYAKAPGAAVLDALQANHDEVVTCPALWRALRINVRHASIEDIAAKLKKYGGELICLPPQSDNACDATFIFEDESSQNAAIRDLAEDYPEMQYAAQQKDSKLFGTVHNGSPLFFGPTLEQLGKLCPIPNIAEEDEIPTADLKSIHRSPAAHANEDRSNILPHLRNRPHNNHAGAFAVITSQSGFLDEFGKPTPLYRAITSQFPKENITLAGNKLYITTARIAAAGKLALGLNKIRNAGEQFLAVIASSDITTRDTQSGKGPRILMGGKQVNALHRFEVQPKMEHGIYAVSPAEARNMQGYRGGIQIEEGVERDIGEHTFVELQGITERVDQITTDGPREMVGRDEEFERCKDALNNLLTHGSTMIVVGGAAGVGKSRLSEEIIKQAFKEGLIIHSFELKAPDEETSELPFSMLSRRVEQIALWGENHGITFEAEFHALRAFLQGQLRNNEQAQRLFTEDAALCARIIAHALKALHGSVALVDDDLQWYDEQSAEVVARIPLFTDKDTRILFLRSSRNLEEELPPAERRANILIEQEGTKRVQIERVSLEPIQFFDIDESGNWTPNQNARRIFASALPVATNWEEYIEKIPNSFLLTTLRHACTEDGRGIPYYVSEIINICLEEYVSVDEEGRINFAEASKINPDNLNIGNVVQNRLLRLPPEEQSICKILTLFPNGITNELLGRVTHGAVPPGTVKALTDKRFIQVDEDGIRFHHDILAKKAAELFSAEMPSIAYRIYRNLFISDDWNEKLQDQMDAIDPAMGFELLKRYVEGMESGSAELDDLMEYPAAQTQLRALFAQAVTALPKLINKSHGVRAQKIGGWVEKRSESTILTPHQKYILLMSLMEGHEIAGDPDAAIKCAEKLLDVINTLPQSDQEKWLTRARIHSTKCRAAISSRNEWHITMAMAALAEHCEPAKLASIKIDPKEAQPFMLQAKITEALGYYFPQYETFEEEERNINRALAILNEVIDEVDNMPNLSRILQQTLFEARRRAAVCIIEKATQRKKHLGDVEAALAMGPSTNRETAAELRQAQQLLEQLFSDNRNSGGVLMPNKKDLARMHIYAGRAALLLSNTPTALHDATIHFDQAEKLSILYPAEYAWNIRESADWRAAAQQRIERRPFTTAEGVQYAGKYQQALSELRQLRHESSPRQFPIHSRAEAIGCNLARLLLQCRDIENHPQSLTMAWNAAMGSTELCISGGRLDKDKRFLPQEELSPEQRKDLQSHLANLGHLIHHAQNERFEISPEDWEFVQTFVIPHAGEAQEKLVNAVGAIERKIEGARGILNGRTPDQLGERAPELQESIRQLAAVKKELEWKLGGIRCCLQ